MKVVCRLALMSILITTTTAYTVPSGTIDFDHLVLLSPHASGEYSGYKRRGNEVVLEKGQRHLLVYPVERLEDASIHGLLTAQLSIRGLQPDPDRILLLSLMNI